MPRRRDQEFLRHVGQRVAQARKERGWTQEQLAEAVGVEPVTLSRLETGARALSLSMLLSVADALDISLADLLDTKRPRPKPSHGAEEAELLRGFERLPVTQKDIVLRLVRDLARTAPSAGDAAPRRHPLPK